MELTVESVIRSDGREYVHVVGTGIYVPIENNDIDRAIMSAVAIVEESIAEAEFEE